MLRPNTLSTTDVALAIKPELGYESQLWVTQSQSAELGTYEITAVNSGVWTPSSADALIIAASPLEVIAVLDNALENNASAVVLTVPGTDVADGPLSNDVTFSPPSYSNDQSYNFPKTYGIQAGTNDAYKTIGTPTVTATSAAIGVKFKLFGVPALSTFYKIPCKTQLNWTSNVPMPQEIQCGRQLSAYVKPGEIPVGTMDCTFKMLTYSDGLARINGNRVTGLVKEVKEDKVDCTHIFFFGLVVAVNVNTGESVDPSTFQGTAKYEALAQVLAPGP